MNMYPVRPEKQQELKEMMARLGIREEDLEESFARSSGRGGQKVNKTSSCVFLRHRPTGVHVKCEKSRSQSLNRFYARRSLAQRIERNLLGKLSEEEIRREKVRKQKSRRRRRATKKAL